MSSYDIGYLVGFLKSVEGKHKHYVETVVQTEASKAHKKYQSRVIPLASTDFIDGYADGVQAYCNQETLGISA